MATTDVPDHGPLDPNATTERVLRDVHELLVEASGDADKTTDHDDLSFYEGQINALTQVEGLLTVQPETDVELMNRLAAERRAPQEDKVTTAASIADLAGVMAPKPHGPRVRLIADYQMFGDNEGMPWMEQVLANGVAQGDLADFNVTGSHVGAYGIQFITFTVDVDLDGKRFKEDDTYETTAKVGIELLNEIIHDSDVEIRWVSPLGSRT